MAGASLRERDRRWSLLDQAMSNAGHDLLIFVGNDYRGHKGTLRYVADFNLEHRNGTVVKPRGGDAILVLPGNLSTQRHTSDWVTDIRFPKKLVSGLVDILRTQSWVRSVGIVGQNQIMRVEDYSVLTESLPRIAFSDATHLFEQVRVVKSAEELVGVEESAYILDRCFDRLLEVAAPGRTEREIAAEMYRTATLLGGEDTLFLTMYADVAAATGRAGVTWGVPRDRVLRSSDLFVFSFEVTGPRGYWTEFSRMVTFQRPSDELAHMAAAVTDGIAVSSAALGEGIDDPVLVQERVLESAKRFGVTSGYWSGHSIGLDVLEAPMIGAEVVDNDLSQSADEKPVLCGPGSVITLHPMLWDPHHDVMGYMADTFVVENNGCRVLSTHPTQLYQVAGGSS
ncbi:MAG: M24 family metallopeptidase [Actinobacteria bacterium]|uniref:Unannotated protein n=1 Tax=freshwater metagenome TaxID=449393 RepID=A0A6J7J765_9ZZZZ|nr:M24 family metallopeptidase [Actinomycetota bacterium]